MLPLVIVTLVLLVVIAILLRRPSTTQQVAASSQPGPRQELTQDYLSGFRDEWERKARRERFISVYEAGAFYNGDRAHIEAYVKGAQDAFFARTRGGVEAEFHEGRVEVSGRWGQLQWTYEFTRTKRKLFDRSPDTLPHQNGHRAPELYEEYVQ